MAATENGRRTFDLSLVTPEGTAFEGEAQMLIVPGAAGEIGILARHAPLVAMLKAGETRVLAQNEWVSFAWRPGARSKRRGPSSNGPKPARRGSTVGTPSSGFDTPRTRSRWQATSSLRP